MDIILAGYNVEAELINRPGRRDDVPLTPETISAAYARISRSSLDIPELRKEAREDVKKARKSNQSIIFSMGHHSVAEHAVFNFDVIGVSRLALEEIEKFRLVSYTEKSQRYVTLEGDYLLPPGIDPSDSATLQRFRETIDLQNRFYKKAFILLKDYLFAQYPHMTEKKTDRNVLEGWAKEDARYILSLATLGQVGITINARNLEHLFRRFSLSSRQEVQTIGKKMFELVSGIAPSLILFPEPSRFETALKNSFSQAIPGRFPGHPPSKDLKILSYTPHADDIILASFVSMYRSMDYEDAYREVEQMPPAEKRELFKNLFRTMEFFDHPPREFEIPGVTFQCVISASNFAQLKRHRIATLLTGDYCIEYGNVLPPNIKTVGLEDEFNRIIELTDETYGKLRDNYGKETAEYILTNSHCRHVIMKMNLREIYHFIRLRADSHAQWDIRGLALRFREEVEARMPLSSLLLCGKSDFIARYESIYGQKPQISI